MTEYRKVFVVTGERRQPLGVYRPRAIGKVHVNTSLLQKFPETPFLLCRCLDSYVSGADSDSDLVEADHIARRSTGVLVKIHRLCLILRTFLKALCKSRGDIAAMGGVDDRVLSINGALHVTLTKRILNPLELDLWICKT